MDLRSVSSGRYIILDNHIHLQETGRFLEAVDMFISAGGSSINLVNLPDPELPLHDYYSSLFEKTIRMADHIRSEREIDVLVTLGPYPLDFMRFRDSGMNPVEEMRRGFDLAIEFAESGKCDAVGEVGRPHFPVPDEVIEQENMLLEYGMQLCRDAGIPMILHTEDLDQDSYRFLNGLAVKTGMPADMINKHHARPEDLKITIPVRKSVLASRSNIRSLLRLSGKFLLETDYVDDKNSWKVIPPDSVPKRAIMIASESENWEDAFSGCFHDEPVSLYGEHKFRNSLSER